MASRSNDILSQTVRTLIEVVGLSELDDLRTIQNQLIQQRRLTAEADRDAGVSTDAMLKKTQQFTRAIEFLTKSLGVLAVEKQKLAGTWIDPKNVVPIAGLEEAAAKMAALAAKQKQRDEEEIERAELKLAKLKGKLAAEQEGNAAIAAKQKQKDEEEIERIELKLAKAKAALLAKEEKDAAIAAKKKQADDDEFWRAKASLEKQKADALALAAVEAARAAKKKQDDDDKETRGALNFAKELGRHKARVAADEERDRKAAAASLARQKADALSNIVPLSSLQLDAVKFMGKESEASAEKAKKFGYSILHVAHAFQDLQYGIGAVLNNIPLVVQAFGGTALQAGASMIALVAMDVAVKALAPSMKELGISLGFTVDKAAQVADTLEHAKEKVEALTKKEHKVQVDFDNLNQAEKILSDLEKRLQAFESLRETDPRKAMAADAAKAITGYGGSDAIEKAIYENDKITGFKRGSGTDEAELAKQKELIRAATESGLETFDYAGSARKIKELEAKIEKDTREAIKAEVGAVGTGDPAAIQRLKNLVRNRPGAFQTVGTGGVTSAEAILSLPSTEQEAQKRIDIEEEMKATDEAEQENRRKYQEAKRKREQEERQNAANLLRKSMDADREAATGIGGANAVGAAAGLLRDMTAEGKRLAGVAEQGRIVGGKAGDDARKEAEKAAKDAKDAAEKAASVSRGNAIANAAGIPVDAEGAERLGKQAERLISNGANPQVAMQKVMLDLLTLTAKMQAEQEAMAGFIGPAQAVLADLQARQMQINGTLRQNARRVNQRRPQAFQPMGN